MSKSPKAFAKLANQTYIKLTSYLGASINAIGRGECYKMPRVNKTPTPFKTYRTIQIRILVVCLHAATSCEPSLAVKFQYSRYWSD